MSEPAAPAGTGLWHAAGCTLAPPDGPGAVLVVAPPQETALATGLLLMGWGLLADRPAPIAVTPSGVRAETTDLALLVADRDAGRLADAGRLTSAPHPARPGSTAVAVQPRSRSGSAELAGIVYVDRTDLRRPASGRERFTRAASALVGGVLAPDLDAAAVVAAHARLAEVPALVVNAGTDVEDVLAWWADL